MLKKHIYEILQNFVDSKRVDEMVRVERLLARWFAFRTAVVLCTLCSVL